MEENSQNPTKEELLAMSKEEKRAYQIAKYGNKKVGKCKPVKRAPKVSNEFTGDEMVDFEKWAAEKFGRLH